MHCLCLKTFALYGSLRYIELHYKDLLLYIYVCARVYRTIISTSSLFFKYNSGGLDLSKTEVLITCNSGTPYNLDIANLLWDLEKEESADPYRCRGNNWSRMCKAVAEIDLHSHGKPCRWHLCITSKDNNQQVINSTHF